MSTAQVLKSTTYLNNPFQWFTEVVMAELKNTWKYKTIVKVAHKRNLPIRKF